MNRQEIIEQIKLIQAGLTQDDNNKSKRRLDLVIEELKKPISLADFLGWEEDVIYVDKDTNIMYKIQDDNLLEIIGQILVIDSAYCFSKFSIEELRKFKKCRGAIIMNIDNLIKELQRINVDKLTDDELEELAELVTFIQVFTMKILKELDKRFFKNEEKNNE